MIVALLSVVTASAQRSAGEWLEALDRSLGQRYGFYVEMSMDEQPIRGYFMVDGDGYYLTLGVMEVYSDGKVRQEINNDRKEVTIDRVDNSSGELLTNPTRAFDFADEEFVVSVAETLDAGCRLSLVPRDDSTGIVEISLVLENKDGVVVPRSISYNYDGEGYLLSLTVADVNQKKLPRWNKEDYRAYDTVSFL